jgi:hypothetical protein
MEITLPIEYALIKDEKTRKAVREKYIELQNGKCWFCGDDVNGEPATFVKEKTVTPKLYPVGFFKNPLHIQHDHNTGMTEGVVHAHCNAVLWEYCGR